MQLNNNNQSIQPAEKQAADVFIIKLTIVTITLLALTIWVLPVVHTWIYDL